jgi:AraC-like DNA-binding protein
MGLLSPDVEPLWIARYDYQPGWQLPLHVHEDYFQMMLVIDGEGEALVDRERIRLKKGQLFFLRPGLPHGIETGSEQPVRTLDTKFFVRRSALRQACLRLHSVKAEVGARPRALLEAMYAEARRHERWSGDICQLMLTQLLLALLADSPEEVKRDGFRTLDVDDDSSLCGRVRRFFHEHYPEKIDQFVLASALHYTYRHIHEVWRQRYGESPLQALLHYRIERAMHLIRYSDYELKRIAEMTGFATVHHFTRMFTRVAGLPPGQWRDRERSGVGQDIVIRPGFVNHPLTIRTENQETP